MKLQLLTIKFAPGYLNQLNAPMLLMNAIAANDPGGGGGWSILGTAKRN